MTLPWFKSRGYKHLDVPVGLSFAEKVSSSKFVAEHSWSPLLRFSKRTKRYRRKKHVTEYKDRPIMYASHRDACIYSKYAFDLSAKLEAHYSASGLTNHVAAYRSLGKSNYDFAEAARDRAIAQAPCIVLCFDIKGFFDHLDHKLLKERLKRMLGVEKLSSDWYSVFREVTRHKWVQKDDLLNHKVFGARFKAPALAPIATIAEICEAKIPISQNKNCFGIPQGTPISSVFANLYMIDFDREISAACGKIGAFYQRYSDDIIVICDQLNKAAIISSLTSALNNEKLEFSFDKTEQVDFVVGGSDPFQYLGFYISYKKTYLRSASLSRQWRKLRRNLKRTAKVGEVAKASGTATKVYTKKLRRKFSPIGTQNFSAYARKAANVLESEQIKKQLRRLERAADKGIAALNK